MRIDGLKGVDGTAMPLEYDVEMISLTPQDAVNVEIAPLEAALVPGDTLQASADVIPAYADDLSVSWRSTDVTVAVVDGGGLVTAVGCGECEIVVTSAGGFEDACKISTGTCASTVSRGSAARPCPWNTTWI